MRSQVESVGRRVGERQRAGHRGGGARPDGGLIAAGTFYRGGKREFWNVGRIGEAVPIELAGATYDRLVLSVPDAAAALAWLESLIQR